MISCVSISYFRQWYFRRLVEFDSGDFQFYPHFSRLSRHSPKWRCNFREAWNWYLEYSEVLLKCRKINLYLINRKSLWMTTRKGKGQKSFSLSIGFRLFRFCCHFRIRAKVGFQFSKFSFPSIPIIEKHISIRNFRITITNASIFEDTPVGIKFEKGEFAVSQTEILIVSYPKRVNHR